MEDAEVHDYGGRAHRRFGSTWNGVSLERVRWQVSNRTTGVTRQLDHQFFITLAGSLPRTRARLEDGARYEGVDFPGAVSFIPATQLRSSDYGRGVIEYAALRVDAAFLRLDTEVPAGSYDGFTNRNDPLSFQIIQALSREAEHPCAAPQLFADSAVTTLFLHLSRPRSAEGASWGSRPPRRGAGSRATLRLVVGYIEDHLAQDLRLELLADLAGMERSRFIAAFKEETGITPARFVARRRLKRAAELLREPTVPIAEVAAEVGLSSQSHLTTNFKRAYGTTPHAYRMSHLR